MNIFPLNEMVDMHLCYNAANSNACALKRLYAQLFWHVVPSHVYISTVDRRLRETGLFAKYVQCCDVRPLEETLLESIAEDPGTSTSVVAGQFGISHTIVWKVYNAYHKTKVHKPHKRDHRPHVEFCKWYNEQCQRGTTFSLSVLFTDEAISMKTGYSTQRITSTELLKTLTPPMSVSDKKNFRRYFRVNHKTLHVTTNPNWPYVSHFVLSEVLPELLEDVALEKRTNMWIQHHDAPSHLAKRE
ncbi:hypothetical protein PR048_013348 [Dryococelus australis]|uniref:Transposase n=1 Tax=Dryococelus australis TaxID=614101 RepID=A0ABQ9HRX4_9NEOP|nr:hypothetical protein PR048_013348 [Dryococelus australis]